MIPITLLAAKAEAVVRRSEGESPRASVQASSLPPRGVQLAGCSFGLGGYALLIGVAMESQRLRSHPHGLKELRGA